ncbi:hypothetical protein RI367_006210 [Sorochytrium milnesiophthora]
MPDTRDYPAIGAIRALDLEWLLQFTVDYRCTQNDIANAGALYSEQWFACFRQLAAAGLTPHPSISYGCIYDAVSKTMVSALTGTGDGRARSASQDRIARRAAIPPTIIRLTSVQDLKSLSVNLPTHINDSVTFEVLASVFANSPGIPLPVRIKGTFSNQTVFAQYIDGVHILDVKPIGRPRRTKATPSSVAQTVQPTMVLPLLLPPSHKSFTMRLVLVQEQSTTGLLKRSPTGVISSLPLLGMDDSNQQYGVTLVGTMAGTASDYCRLYGYSLAKATTSNLDTLLVWSYTQDAKAWVESYNAELYGQSALLLRVRAANDTFSEPIPVDLPGAVAICERSGGTSDGQVCIKRGHVIPNAVVPSAQAAATCHKAGRTLVSLPVLPDIKAIGRLLADCFGAGAAVWVKDWEGHPNAPCVQVLAGVASAGALNSTVAFPSSCTQKAHALCV